MQSQIIQKASILYDLTRYSEVVILLKEETTTRLEDVRGAWFYSASLMMLDHMQDALKAAEQGLRNSPEFYPLLLLRSEMYKQLGLYSKAADDIQHALRIAPEDPDCHIMAGSVSLTADRYDLAIKHAQKALSLTPKSVDARLVKASALFQQGHDQQARELAQEALSLEPDHPEIMGFIAGLTENRADKIILLGKALRLDPTDKAQQKEFRQHTSDLKRDVASAALLMAAGIGVWLFMPQEQEHVFFTILPVVGPMLLLYYSRYLWLASLMLFTGLLLTIIHDPDFFHAGWQLESLATNLFYLLFLAGFSLFAAFIMVNLRIIFRVSSAALKEKWQQYIRARRVNLEAEYLAELVISRRTYFYLIGAVLIPLMNIIAHHFPPELFWSCFLLSFAGFSLALVLLVGLSLFQSVFPTLLYGFFTILVTLLAGALLDNTITTFTALFIGAAVATHLTYLNSAGLKHRK
ncbi:MAG: tetratricopeptide repeat protein [Proteobacteria bacterium]|nr:tetratricopeptide repeat protein [Pseudomonadota bacterium]MBU1419621.1 tetratricopeptide repeat protein [Pseudomonadota bacterium]MBU1453413.1 tetratricopeptide repeat protein [Pseudomonadota bacterium]